MELSAEKIERALKWKFELQMFRKIEVETTSIEKDVATDWDTLNSWIGKQGLQNNLVKILSEDFTAGQRDLCIHRLGDYNISIPKAEIEERSKQLQKDWVNFKHKYRHKLEANIENAAEYLYRENTKTLTSKDAIITRKIINNTSDQQIKIFVQPNLDITEQVKGNQTVPIKSAPSNGTNIESNNPSVFNITAPSKIPEKTTEQNSESNKTVQLPEASSVAPPVAAQWKYLPVPDGPNKHSEYNAQTALSPEGFKIVAARVRGKMHKHNGTNCDDWFEVDTIGPWTIIAVSDGAGSCRLSRVGSREASKAATQSLSKALQEHRLNQRDIWNVDTFRRDSSGVFGESDIEFVQKSLHGAMIQAYDAMEKQIVDLQNSADHYIYLGDRRPTIDDLSATLLIAVHATVNFKGRPYSFIMTCHIGDGMIAALANTGMIQLLATPDTGDFSGQTKFLTSSNQLDLKNLISKTFPFFSPLRALMVMTDGVSDDYFPNDPEMLRLYGDLVLNRAISIAEPSKEIVSAAIADTKLLTLDSILAAEYANEIETVTADNPRPKIWIKSIQKYAETLGKTLQEVLASPALLWAGTFGCSDEVSAPNEIYLQVWLDTYFNRGSFDDRTLVILHPENLP